MSSLRSKRTSEDSNGNKTVKRSSTGVGETDEKLLSSASPGQTPTLVKQPSKGRRKTEAADQLAIEGQSVVQDRSEGPSFKDEDEADPYPPSTLGEVAVPLQIYLG